MLSNVKFFLLWFVYCVESQRVSLHYDLVFHYTKEDIECISTFNINNTLLCQTLIINSLQLVLDMNANEMIISV